MHETPKIAYYSFLEPYPKSKKHKQTDLLDQSIIFLYLNFEFYIIRLKNC